MNANTHIKAVENGWNFNMYKDEITKAMDLLANDPKTIFLGQNVEYSGSIMSASLKNVAAERKIELPLIEDTQMGMSIGLSLEGFLPVSIYPRIDFLILAINQLANHLDKVREMSDNRYDPKVIVRTAVGSTKPLYPGLQHCTDYTDTFKALLKNVDVVKLLKSSDILPAYDKALKSDRSTILIEVADLYSTE